MVTNEMYVIVRKAIEAATLQSGKLYEQGQESHYQALAAVMALRKAGYEVTRRLDN
jgi:ABC-type methionine transport system ATPase subunit